MFLAVALPKVGDASDSDASQVSKGPFNIGTELNSTDKR